MKRRELFVATLNTEPHHLGAFSLQQLADASVEVLQNIIPKVASNRRIHLAGHQVLAIDDTTGESTCLFSRHDELQLAIFNAIDGQRTLLEIAVTCTEISTANDTEPLRLTDVEATLEKVSVFIRPLIAQCIVAPVHAGSSYCG